MTADDINEKKVTEVLMVAVNDAAEQIDAVPAEHRRRALGMLAARYDLQLRDNSSFSQRYYAPTPKRKKGW